MRKKRLGGGTAACTIRLTEGSQYCGVTVDSRRDAQAAGATECFKGDSWFTSIPVAEYMAENNHEYVGAMKTSHKLYPKEQIEEKMQGWPSGSNIVLECQTPTGHTLLAIGYKYNQKKILCFLATKNAGSTKPGNPYIAKFSDSIGNLCEREVERPAIISNYFGHSNILDAHNHARQGELQLEKRWVTKNGWFRLATTYIGITITDAWKLYKHGVADQKQKETTIVEFADRLAADCCRNTHSGDTSILDSLYITIPGNDAPPVAEVKLGNRRSDEISPVSVATTIESIVDQHHFKDNSDREDDGNGRPKRRACRSCSKATQKKCQHPRCKQEQYNANGAWKKGVFYCEEHWKDHHKEVSCFFEE